MTLSIDEFRSQCHKFMNLNKATDGRWLLQTLNGRILQDVIEHDPTSLDNIMLYKREYRVEEEKVISYEYSVTYSDSYEVPIMYFCINDQSE